MLPVPGIPRSIEAWRPADWVTGADTLLALLALVEDEEGQPLPPTLPARGELATVLRSVLAQHSTERVHRQSTLTAWYLQRVRGIDAVSGQLHLAVELLQWGAELGVAGLEDTGVVLEQLNALVYDHG